MSGKKGVTYQPLLDRLSDKFVVGDGCWAWIAGRQGDGYGAFKMDGRSRLAHVVLFELLVGAVPAGKELDHLCRNRACVRPGHLEPVPHKTNVRRGASPAVQRSIPKARRRPNGKFGPAL
jgi:hypothetical protein